MKGKRRLKDKRDGKKSSECCIRIRFLIGLESKSWRIILPYHILSRSREEVVQKFRSSLNQSPYMPRDDPVEFDKINNHHRNYDFYKAPIISERNAFQAQATKVLPALHQPPQINSSFNPNPHLAGRHFQEYSNDSWFHSYINISKNKAVWLSIWKASRTSKYEISSFTRKCIKSKWDL